MASRRLWRARPSGPRTPTTQPTPGPRRTCVACGQKDAPRALVRIVIAPDGEVAIDITGGALGRGGYVHPSASCLASAPRGLMKSFRRPIAADAARLSGLLDEAARRRIAGLLGAAVRSGQVLLGAESAGAAWQRGRASLLVVARDAAAAAQVGSVKNAIAEGGAIAWGSKAELGKLVGRSELAVLGIASRSFASALRGAVAMLMSAGPRAGSEVLPADVATEVR